MLFSETISDLFTIRQAAEWASKFLNKNVTESNISYLIQYGKIRKIGQNGSTLISQKELEKYYESFYGKREIDWKSKLGADLNWNLSFDYLKEKDTTKHVHRLHPYKGKFIPQLVEYFLDTHTDEFKKEVFFEKGDIVLDPFSGSGTTLVQANELGIHAIGVDISEFNAMISNVKISNCSILELTKQIQNITEELQKVCYENHVMEFEDTLSEELYKFNSIHFPSPEYKCRLNAGEIDEDSYAKSKEKEFLKIYNKLIKKYNINSEQDASSSFLDKWYIAPIRREIDSIHDLVKKVRNIEIRKIILVILSRTIRSCRATTHADLATLKEPVLATYYCGKHGKMCKPLFFYSWLVEKIFSGYN